MVYGSETVRSYERNEVARNTVLDATVHRTVALRAMASATGWVQSDKHACFEEVCQ